MKHHTGNSNSAPAFSRSPLRVHIDCVVLEGIPLASAQAPQFQAAFARELGRLLSNERVNVGEIGKVGSIPSSTVQLAPSGSARAWGRQVATSVFASLNPAAKASSAARSS